MVKEGNMVPFELTIEDRVSSRDRIWNGQRIKQQLRARQISNIYKEQNRALTACVRGHNPRPDQGRFQIPIRAFIRLDDPV